MKEVISFLGSAMPALAACAMITACSTAGPGGTQKVPAKEAGQHSAYLWVKEEQGLRMRETPDQKGKLITVIPYASKVEMLSEKGEPMTIAGASGKWTEVNWNSKKGWVFGGFLGDAEPALFLKGGSDPIAVLQPYYAKWAKERNAHNPDTVARIVNHGIRIEEQDGNFHVVMRLRTNRVSAEDTDETNSLWAKVPGGWKLLIEDDESGWGCKIKLGYINKDRLVDAVVIHSGGIDFYLGKNAYSMRMIDSLPVEVNDALLAPCDSMTIRGMENENNDREVVLTFDCRTNRVIKLIGK